MFFSKMKMGRTTADWWEDVLRRTNAEGLENSGHVKNVANLYVQNGMAKIMGISAEARNHGAKRDPNAPEIDRLLTTSKTIS